MGKLKKIVSSIRSFLAHSVVRKWILPVVLGIATVSVLTTTIFANTEPSSAELQTYLQNNQLGVGARTVNGYQQIYYNYNSTDYYISSGVQNNRGAIADGQYVAWTTETQQGDQIVLYNVLTKTTLQLTSSRTNKNPSISGNRVVWQTWTGSRWAVYYYNGSTTSLLSAATSSAVRPSIYQNTVVYSERQNTGTWRSLSYNTTNAITTVINTGTQAASGFARFVNGVVVTTVQ